MLSRTQIASPSQRQEIIRRLPGRVNAAPENSAAPERRQGNLGRAGAEQD